MSLTSHPPARLALAAGAIAVLAGLGGYGLARLNPPQKTVVAEGQSAQRPVLYWYDPMVPAQHFDKPGKSPFMDMQLVPKYAGDTDAAAGVSIDPTRSQNLGVRYATVERGELDGGLSTVGVLEFNDRDVAIVQAKAAGFVQRVYARAPGDVIAAGTPLADLLVPEWSGAQSEFLAVRRTGDAALTDAARQRLILLGMPAATVADVERSGRPRNSLTLTTPIGGVIKTLSVRSGMTVSAGQTLAEINGVSRVWLNAAAPEDQASQIRVGQTATATLAAFPGERFAGTVAAILPQANAETRTLTVRIELANRSGRLRPGMFANVEFGGASQPALLVPSEAVIRTGRRTLVMLAQPGGRYLPVEIQAGREGGGKTQVLAGLSEGDKVVASGQFLIDSEASLSGLQARSLPTAEAASPAVASGGRPTAQTSPPASPTPRLYESVGRIEQLSADSVTLSHQPVPALQWPAMTMQFRLADPNLARGLKRGDQVRFGFDQAPAGPTVRQMTPAGAQ
jgi:Cu(I)/Ag(I) efflux system membrane fusion protein